MAELTLEQRRALALARARLKLKQRQQPQEQTPVESAVSAPYRAIGETIQEGAAPGGFRDVVGRGYQQAGETLGEGAQTGLDALKATGRGALRGGRLAAEGASRGLMELIQLPGAALNQAPRLANLIPGVDGIGPIVEDYNPAMEAAERMGLVGVTEPENRLEEYVLQGGRAAGGALGGGGALSLAMRGAQGTSAAGQIGNEIARAFNTRPAMFLGADAGGGFGAAAGGDAGGGIAEWLGAEETGQEVGRGIGSLLGGVAGGAVPAAGPPAIRRSRDYLQEQFAPYTERGSRLRAGRQLQRQVTDPDDPEAAVLIEQAARRAEQAPEGITPARATREPGLIAQENRLAEDIPPLGRQIRGQNATTQADAEAGIRGLAGAPTPKASWTYNLIQRVAAPGAQIEPGDTDRMLRQAFESFDPAYRQFDGHTINPSKLGQRVDQALKDPDLFVGEGTRNSVRRWVDGQLQALGRRADDRGALTSDDMLALRQNVRGRIRDARGSQSEAAKESQQVLSRVEKELTKYIDEALPEAARTELQALDNQYRQFKRIEEAAFRGGEGELNPKKVLDSIRRRASSQGQHTRGDQESLRRQVIHGLEGEDFLKDRDLLTKAVRGVPADQRRPVQSKLLNALSDRARLAPDDQGNRLLSGSKLREQIRANRDALKASGMSDGELSRLDNLAQKIVDVQRKTPEEIQTIFTDGPNSLAELAAAVAGARAGQNLAGGGIGASLVVAQFMSNRARKLLSTAFGEHATKLLEDAALDPKLYASLLRTRKASIPKQREAAATIEAWLLQNIADPEGPELAE